uniref:Uncharacterized protein n=1 Tax=Glossina morsitans morsitans TaxID=37546 RepID=A0A1B0GBX3_GLOMM
MDTTNMAPEHITEYWNEKAQDILKQKLVEIQSPTMNNAKNIIMFLDDVASEFNTNQPIDGAAADKKSEGIAPVLIKQHFKSAEGNFQMFEMTFSIVCVVAIVRNIETSSTKIY